MQKAQSWHGQVRAQSGLIRDTALGVVLFGLLLTMVSDGVFVRSITARIRAALNLARTVAGAFCSPANALHETWVILGLVITATVG